MRAIGVRHLDWLMSRDTGISSKAIFAAMTGADYPDFSSPGIPLDPGDFGRCHRLLRQFPEWRARLDEMPGRFPGWAPLAEAWDELTALYEAESPSGRCPRLHTRLRELRDEAYRADGWVAFGSGGWRRVTP